MVIIKAQENTDLALNCPSILTSRGFLAFKCHQVCIEMVFRNQHCKTKNNVNYLKESTYVPILCLFWRGIFRDSYTFFAKLFDSIYLGPSCSMNV
jgi:hypothetical protein